MTDCEIVKALECCGTDISARFNCRICPMRGTRDCMTLVYKEALSLINRQNAEIEKWRKSAHEWREEVMRLLEEGD